MLDGSRPEPLTDMDVVNRELSQYTAALTDRPQLLVVNKIDMEEVKNRIGELKAALATRGLEAQFLSAAAGSGTDELVRRMAEMLSTESREVVPESPPVVRPEPRGRRFEVRRERDGFRVEGERMITFAEMMPVEVEEGRQELWWRLGRWGVSAALRRAGARPGALVRAGEIELEWAG